MQMPEPVAHDADHAPCLPCSYSDVNQHACSGCCSECSSKVAFLFLDELTGHLHGMFEWELFMPTDKDVVRSHVLLDVGFVPALGQSHLGKDMCSGASLACLSRGCVSAPCLLEMTSQDMSKSMTLHCI